MIVAEEQKDETEILVQLGHSLKVNIPRYCYIFLRYCPPTSNIAAVSCPSEQYLHASISTSNIFSFRTAAFPLKQAVSVVPPQRPLRRDFAPSSLRLQIQFMVHMLRRY